MTFEDAYFKKKVLKPDNLEPFGFTATEQGYEFRKPLIAEELEARLFIDLEGKLTGQVVDSDLDEPYDIFQESSGYWNLRGSSQRGLWRTSVTGS